MSRARFLPGGLILWYKINNKYRSSARHQTDPSLINSYIYKDETSSMSHRQQYINSLHGLFILSTPFILYNYGHLSPPMRLYIYYPSPLYDLSSPSPLLHAPAPPSSALRLVFCPSLNSWLAQPRPSSLSRPINARPYIQAPFDT